MVVYHHLPDRTIDERAFVLLVIHLADVSVGVDGNGVGAITYAPLVLVDRKWRFEFGSLPKPNVVYGISQ